MPRERYDHAAAPAHSRFSAVVFAETVRALEHDAPLEDGAEMRQAFAQASTTQERLALRAQLLATRIGLDAEWLRWRDLVRVVCIGLALLAFIGAYGIAASVIGSGRTINAVTAFFALLGMPTLTLLIWLAAISPLAGAAGGLFGQLSFGAMLLGLLSRIPGARSPHAQTLARSTQSVLQRARLLPWAFGHISHVVWSMSFVCIIVALWFAFSFQQYRLTWETTILDADFFVRFMNLTGTIPHWLGFPFPDTATLLNPGTADGDYRAWAWWLIGCACVYGLLPRLIGIPLCRWMWRRGVAKMDLDTSEPYYRKLIARFAEMEQSQIVDVEHRAQSEKTPRTQPGQWQSTSHVIGFELPPEWSFPPTELANETSTVTRIAGAIDERRRTLDLLAQTRPRTTLVVCDASASPDRGTERFLRDVMQHSAQAGVLLIAGNAPDASLQQQRWQQWLAHAQLTELTCFTDGQAARDWLENTHD